MTAAPRPDCRIIPVYVVLPPHTLLMDVAVAYEQAARVNEGLHPYDAVEEEAQA